MSADKKYKDGDIVWIKLRNNYWWPGEVGENLRQQFKHVKKKPYCVVKFFNEDTFEYVHSANRVLPFRCSKKQEFIRLGLALHKAKYDFMEKFPADVEFAERLTQPNFIVNRPGSIIKAVLTQPLVHSCEESEEDSHNEPEIDEDKPSTSSMASRRLALRQITSKRRTQSISTIKILDIAPSRSSIGESTVKTDSSNPSTSTAAAAAESTVNAVPPDSTAPPPNKTDANLYRCGMCDFTSVRQNVIVLHRKTHGRLDRSASTALPTPAESRQSSSLTAETDANNTSAETMPLNGPSDVVAEQLTEDFSSSAYIEATPSAKPTPVRRGRGPRNRNVQNLRTSTRTLRSSSTTGGQPFVASSTPNRTAPLRAKGGNAAVAAAWLDDDRNIFASSAEDDAAPSVSDLDDLANAVKASAESTLEESEESKQETLEQQEKAAAALRQMIAADWSDIEEEKDTTENQNKIPDTTIGAEPANSSSILQDDQEAADITATTMATPTTPTTPICSAAESSTAATSPPAPSTPSYASAKVSGGYCRNIPKKDRYRDAVINDFNANNPDSNMATTSATSINTATTPTNHSSSSCVPAAAAESPPPFIVIPDSSASSDASFDDSVVLIGTTKPSDVAATSSRGDTSAAAASTTLSCFDFDEDEEENESDLLTSIANFKRKYYSLEKNTATTTTQPAANGNNGHLESGAAVNNGSIVPTQSGDDQLNDEIEKLLQQTKSTAAQVVATDGIDLPAKERNKRIFRSRNIEEAETTTAVAKGTTSEMRKKLKEAHSALAEYSKQKQKAPTPPVAAATKEAVEPQVENMVKIAEPIAIIQLASDESSSEAGAEFGSPASMLDEERMPNPAALEYLNRLQQAAQAADNNERSAVATPPLPTPAVVAVEPTPNAPANAETPPKKKKLNKKSRKLKLKLKKKKIKLKRAKREALKKEIAATMQTSGENGPIDMHKYAMSPSKALQSTEKTAKRKLKVKRKHSKKPKKSSGEGGSAVGTDALGNNSEKQAHEATDGRKTKSSLDSSATPSNFGEPPASKPKSSVEQKELSNQILPEETNAKLQLAENEEAATGNSANAALRKRRSHIKITPRRHHRSQDQQEHSIERKQTQQARQETQLQDLQKNVLKDLSSKSTQVSASEIICGATVDPKDNDKLHEIDQKMPPTTPSNKKITIDRQHTNLARTQTNQQDKQPLDNEASVRESEADMVLKKAANKGKQPLDNEASVRKSETDIALKRAPSKLVEEQVPLICSEQEELTNEKEKRKIQDEVTVPELINRKQKTTIDETKGVKSAKDMAPARSQKTKSDPEIEPEKSTASEPKQKPRTTADIAEKLQHIADVYRNAANKRTTATTLNVEHNYQQRVPHQTENHQKTTSEGIQKALSKEDPLERHEKVTEALLKSNLCDSQAAEAQLKTPNGGLEEIKQGKDGHKIKSNDPAEGPENHQVIKKGVQKGSGTALETVPETIVEALPEKVAGEVLETITGKPLETEKGQSLDGKEKLQEAVLEAVPKAVAVNQQENILGNQQGNLIEEVPTNHPPGKEQEEKFPSTSHEMGKTLAENEKETRPQTPESSTTSTGREQKKVPEAKENNGTIHSTQEAAEIPANDDISTSDVLKEQLTERFKDAAASELAVNLSESPTDISLHHTPPHSSTTPLELDNLEELPDTTSSSTPSPPPFSPTQTPEQEDISADLTQNRSQSSPQARDTRKERLVEFRTQSNKYQKETPNEKPIILQQEIIQNPLSSNDQQDQQCSKPHTKRPYERLPADALEEPCKQQKKIEVPEVQQPVAQKHTGIDSRGKKYMIIKNSAAESTSVQSSTSTSTKTIPPSSCKRSPEQTCTVTSSTSESEQQKQLLLSSIPTPQTSPSANSLRNAAQNNHHHHHLNRSLSSSSSNCSSSSASTRSSLSLRREQRLHKHSQRQQQSSATSSSSLSLLPTSQSSLVGGSGGANDSASPTSIGTFDSVPSPLPAKISKTTTEDTDSGTGSGSLDNAVAWLAGSEVNRSSQQRVPQQQQQQSATEPTQPPVHHLHNRTPRKQPQQHRSSSTTSSSGMPKKHLPLMAAQTQNSVVAASPTTTTPNPAPNNNFNEQLAQSEEANEPPQILAVPTEPIPGYNDTFLLCTKGSDRYKPMDNCPLYLDHESNQLVPVPTEDLVGVVIKLLSDRIPTTALMHSSNATETQNRQEDQENEEEEMQQEDQTTNSSNEPKSSNMPGAQLICLQPIDSDNVDQQQQQQISTDEIPPNLVDPALIAANPITAVDVGVSEGRGGGDDDDAIDQHAYLPQDDLPHQLVPENAIILNIGGQQVVLDAATFAHILANPENSTQLITEDGTEFTLPPNVLLSMRAQQMAEAEQHQLLLAQQLSEAQAQEVVTGTEAGSSADLIGVTIDGAVLLEGSDGSTIMIPVAADSEMPEHITPLIPPATTSETNSLLETPIMSTLETPSTTSGAAVGITGTHGEGIVALDVRSRAALYEAVTGADIQSHCRPTLEDSLAVIGVTTQASAVPPSLELPITVTNPNIAPPPPARLLQRNAAIFSASVLEAGLAGVVETDGNIHTNAAGS